MDREGGRIEEARNVRCRSQPGSMCDAGEGCNHGGGGGNDRWGRMQAAAVAADTARKAKSTQHLPVAGHSAKSGETWQQRRSV